MDFKIRLAGRNILIHSLYMSIYYECSGFIEENTTPDFEIFVDPDQVLAEYERLNRLQPGAYSVKAAETLLVQRIIAEAMLDYNTFLMHGAVVAVKNRSYLFTAPSGTGKSTHIQKWLKNVNGSFIVNGDKPLVSFANDVAYACGTPWNGKERLGCNSIIPLQSIVIMERSEGNHMEELPFINAFPKLLEQTYQPWEESKIRKRLELLVKLKECVSFYRFSFNNFKEDAFQVAFDALVNQQSNQS